MAVHLQKTHLHALVPTLPVFICFHLVLCPRQTLQTDLARLFWTPCQQGSLLGDLIPPPFFLPTSPFICLDPSQPAPNYVSVPSAMTCPANTVYQSCMTPCPATCAKFVTPKVCEGPCVEGCASLPGYIYSDTQSLPVTHCGCTTNGIYYKVRMAEKPGSPGAENGMPDESRPSPVFTSSLPAG